jgi:hypothetical protein
VRETCRVFSRRMDGRLRHCCNWLGLCRFYAEAGSVLPVGEPQVRMEFGYGGGLAKGGGVTLYERKA